MTDHLQPLPQNASPELPENPTPQDFGFPLNPTVHQLTAWRNQELFLAVFAKYGVVSAAAAEAGISVWAEERWSKTDLYGFKKRKEMAGRQALGLDEMEVIRRGREGVVKPVYWRGQEIGKVHEYSDNLLMFRTKRLDPAYKDNYDPRPAQQQIQITRIIIHGVGPGGVEPSVVEAHQVTALNVPSASVIEEDGNEATTGPGNL